MTYQSKRKIAMFTALCLFCSMIELVIPKPAFIKIGFSNIPIMLALYCGFTAPQFWLLVIMRIIAQGFINGTILSYSFVLSLTAGVISSFVMWILFRVGKFSFVSISMAGAFFSNCAQIAVSSVFLGKGVFSLAPLIIGIGLFTSFALGLFCELYIRKSGFVHHFTDISYFATLTAEPSIRKTGTVKTGRIIKIVFSVLILLACFFSSKVTITAVSSLILLLCCLASKRKVRVIPILWLIVRTVFINILLPSGKILFSIGPLHITIQSILIGLRRSFILLGSQWFSKFIIPDKNEMAKSLNPSGILYMTFAYFKTITENWYHVDHGKNTVERVDNTLASSVTMESLNGRN